jgi:hypothetical protein
MAENEKETPVAEFLVRHNLPTHCDSCKSSAIKFDEEFDPLVYFACGTIFRVGVGWTRWEQSDICTRLSAAERENERLQTFIDALPEKIRKCGEPGPGGINITNGVPSEVYIAIGRDRYDTEYEVAEATAEAVRTNTADSIPRWLAALYAADRGRGSMSEKKGFRPCCHEVENIELRAENLRLREENERLREATVTPELDFIARELEYEASKWEGTSYHIKDRLRHWARRLRALAALTPAAEKK